MIRAFGLSLVSLALVAPADPKPNDATLNAPPANGAKVLFDGSSLKGWVKADGKTPAAWPLQDGILAVGKGQGTIQTTATFGDFQLHLEFNVPLMPDARGQARGNSGVYLGGVYELQVLDSYGLKPEIDGCGAIYKQIIPSVNACKPPLQWQTYDVTFHKAQPPRKARVTVVQNGIKIIDDAEIVPTPGGIHMRAGEDGPLLLQDHGNDVHFRNIWVVPL